MDVRIDRPEIFISLKKSLSPSYRIFCFPHGGGNPRSFKSWLSHFPEDVELICLNLPGRGGRSSEPAIHDMNTLTSLVISGLREYCDRPFMFFGHSMGALVAYEVARVLEASDVQSPFHLVLSGHKAADVPPDELPMYQYTDDKLADLIYSLGVIPDEAMEDKELLLDYLLPSVRADFEIAETYDRALAKPLGISISAMGGRQDTLLDENDLNGWSRLTTAHFSCEMFEGGHFYVEDLAESVISVLLGKVEEVKEKLPVSVCFGKKLPYSDLPLHEQLRKQSVIAPDSPAIVSPVSSLTFRELDDLSEKLANQLRARGQKPGSRVGILMSTSAEYAVALFGILKAGAAYVALDVSLPASALGRVLRTADIEVVLVNESFADALPLEWSGQVLSLGTSQDEQHEGSCPVDTVSVDLDVPAQIVFSSGTTGEPKGIVCPHRSAVCSYEWRYRELPYAPDEREAVNIFLVWEIMRPILAGFPAYVVPDNVIYDPNLLVDYLEQNKITRMLFTPSLLETIVNSGVIEGARALPNLRLIYLNGEVVTGALLASIKNVLPHVKIVSDYSIAEIHDVAHLDISDIEFEVAYKPIPVGPPQQNVNAYVLGNDLAPVPEGFLGEVFIGGDAVGLGYLDNPEMTQERFIPDVFRGEGTMFRTGDSGRLLPNGCLEIFGRLDFMVKMRGYSIVPSAIEATLLWHKNVLSAAVEAVCDTKTGQVDRLVAYVVLKDMYSDWRDSLRNHLKSEVAYYAIPSDFIALKEFPIAANGKLDRSRLHELGMENQVETTVLKKPADRIETILCEVWRDILKTSPEHKDDFFNCGGHSLLAAQFCIKLQKKLDIKLDVVEIFLHSTFADILTLCQSRADTPENTTQKKMLHSTNRVSAKSDIRRPGSGQDIAVIGMAARFPGGDCVESFWENLRKGVCSIRQISHERLKSEGISDDILERDDYICVGSHLDDVAYFDPEFWGLSMYEASLMDPQHRLFLECCWKALESAGCNPTLHEGRVGVFAGSFLPLYLLHHLKGAGLMDPTDAPLASLVEFGNDKDYLVSRVSYMLNLTGPSIAVQTSCSAGLVAISTAAQFLASGHCDVALAGASSIIFPQAGYQYVEGFINSPDGVCRAFDANANGTVLGDGVGVIVMKRLEDAIAAKDPIQAVVKGTAINNDGREKISYSSPSAKGQAAVVRQALKSANICQEEIQYIETHGTGTKIGDPIEVRALGEVFGKENRNDNPCALGSIKPNIGHANIAAGVASFIKTVLILKHGEIPPTININQLNEELRLENTPFFVNEKLRAWPRPKEGLRTAGVTSLGIGGTNCHVVLQEWPETEGGTWSESVARGSHVLCLSAKTPSALSRACKNLADFIQNSPAVDLGDVAYTLRFGRAEFDYRAVVVASNNNMAVEKLIKEADCAVSATAAHSSPLVAFMLPGGGLQYPRMFKELFDCSSVFRDTFLSCAAAGQSFLESDLKSLVFGPNSASRIASFEEINVAMFSVQYAMAQLLKTCGVHPDYLVGHSMSEYVAAALAGIFEMEDAIGLMVQRSRAMAEIGIDGAMLAVQCSKEYADQVLMDAAWREFVSRDEISVGVVNSETSVVLTGKRKLLEKLQAQFDKIDISSQMIGTAGVASHSPLMKPAKEHIDAHIDTIKTRTSQIDIALNSGEQWLKAGEHLNKTYWSQQATGLIRFDRSLISIIKASPTALVDIGPSRSLGRFAIEATSLLNESPTQVPEIISAARGRNDTDFLDRHVLLEALGHLWNLGVKVDWAQASVQIEPAGNYRRIAIPTYSFDRHYCWSDSSVTNSGPLQNLAGSERAKERRKGEAFLYTQTWSEAFLPRFTTENLDAKSKRWLILSDRKTGDICESDYSVLANLVSDLLKEAGHEVVRVCRLTKASGASIKVKGVDTFIDPTREGMEALFSAESSSENQFDGILCFWHLGNNSDFPVSPGTANTDVLQSYDVILNLARALAATSLQKEIDLWIISDRCVQVGEEQIYPEKSCILGPAIVLPQENPMVNCRVIDVGTDDVSMVGSRLFAEIARENPCKDALIALRGAQRWVPHYPPLELANGDLKKRAIQSNGVYLITGGLGRIGLSLAEHLATLGSRVIVVSRRKVDNLKEFLDQQIDPENNWERQIIKLLGKLENAEGKVLLRQSDVSDFKALTETLEWMLQEFGRIDGIFHAAGLADLQFLSKMEDETSGREFAPKVLGTRNLYAAIEHLKSQNAHVPDFVFLFSSLASILGGPAMAAYASANRFMDAFTRQNIGQLGVRWINTNWDDWSYSYEEQVTAAYESSEARERAFDPEEGIAIIERILATVDSGQVIVATRPLPPRIEEWVDQKSKDADQNRVEIVEIKEHGKKQLTEEEIRTAFLTEVQTLLKVPRISLQDNFFNIGGDSLLATSLLMRLKKSTYWKQPQLGDIFKSPTLGDLYNTICRGV